MVEQKKRSLQIGIKVDSAHNNTIWKPSTCYI